jgi:hypothetical protein
MIFAPTLCDWHTITFCMAGRGDSVDGVATCYRLDSRIWTPVRERFSISPTCLDQPWGPLSCVYKGKWPTFLGVQQWGLELITLPKLVLIFRISIAIPLFLLYATIGMIWSDLYRIHVCGWLFMNSMFLYLHKRKATNNKIAKSCEFTRKVCFFLSSNSY